MSIFDSQESIPPAPRLRAACKGLPSDWWFPEFPPTTETQENQNKAYAICKTCIDREPCAEYGIENPRILGIWGGLSWRTRRDMRVVRERQKAKQQAKVLLTKKNT